MSDMMNITSGGRLMVFIKKPQAMDYSKNKAVDG
jgi:hypothetical protein